MAYRRSISASAWLLTAALAFAGCASAGEDDVDGSIGGDEGGVDDGGGSVDGGGTCIPTAADEPDDAFRDTNCDGVDGDASRAVFVDTAGGVDTNPGTRELPKKTINAAINQAAGAIPKKVVFISAGTYNETVMGQKGVSLYGGYSRAQNWARAAANISKIVGAGTGMIIDGVNIATKIDRLTITATAGMTTGSSIAVVVSNSNNLLTFNSCSIMAAPGTDGAAGAAGARGGNGAVGQPGGGGSCDGSGRGAGGAAGNAITRHGKTVTWLGGNNSTQVKGAVV